MAKFVFLLTTCALLLVLANASIYRVEIDEANPGRRGHMSCREQMEQQDNLRQCRRFMEEECCSGRCSCSCGGGSCGSKDNERLMKCCEQLEEMKEPCRCRNLKQMVEQQMMDESMSQRMKEKMYDTAEGILRMCRLEPMKCDMSSRSWFA